MKSDLQREAHPIADEPSLRWARISIIGPWLLRSKT